MKRAEAPLKKPATIRISTTNPNFLAEPLKPEQVSLG